MKDYVRADLSRQPLSDSITQLQHLYVEIQMMAQTKAEEAVQLLLKPLQPLIPQPLSAEAAIEGITVTIKIDGQAQQQPDLLEQRINTAILRAVKELKRKANVRRGARKKKTSSTKNDAWFWKTFTNAVKRARATLKKNEILKPLQVAVEWGGKDDGCSLSNLNKLCRKYSFAENGKHFEKALARVSGNDNSVQNTVLHNR